MVWNRGAKFRIQRSRGVFNLPRLSWRYCAEKQVSSDAKKVRQWSCYVTAMADGPKIHKVKEFTDRRGHLQVFENGTTLGFTPVRCFVIRDVPDGETRGGHAVSCDEFVTALQGSCHAVVTGSTGRHEYLLGGGIGLHVPRNTWFRLERFSAGAVVAVFASKEYGETTYVC